MPVARKIAVHFDRPQGDLISLLSLVAISPQLVLNTGVVAVTLALIKLAICSEV